MRSKAIPLRIAVGVLLQFAVLTSAACAQSSGTDTSAKSPASSTPEDYRIGSGDVLTVSVADGAEFGGKFRVTDSGLIEIPGLPAPIRRGHASQLGQHRHDCEGRCRRRSHGHAGRFSPDSPPERSYEWPECGPRRRSQKWRCTQRLCRSNDLRRRRGCQARWLHNSGPGLGCFRSPSRGPRRRTQVGRQQPCVGCASVN